MRTYPVAIAWMACCLACGSGSDGSHATSTGEDGGNQADACVSDRACQPANPCTVGRTTCASPSGAPACMVTGDRADGTPCGDGLVCSSGSCVGVVCTAGTPCAPSDPCREGTVTCASSLQPGQCTTTGLKPDGAACGAGLVCTAGVCGAADTIARVQPNDASVAVGGSVTLTAEVTVGSGHPSLELDWAVDPGSAGSVSPGRGTTTVYTAPMTPGKYAVWATSVADPTKRGSCIVTVALAPGTITCFPTPTAPGGFAREVHGVVAGPDGNVWFTSGKGINYRGQIGRMALDGTVTAFEAPGRPAGIAVGPDGNLWVADDAPYADGQAIYRITPSGSLTTFSLIRAVPSTRPPSQIAAGPDGAMWFTTPNAIGRISMDGASITEFGLPASYGTPTGIALGPDGFLWFSASIHMGRISTAGELVEVPDFVDTGGIAKGPDGAMWVTFRSALAIARIPPSGAYARFPTPTSTGSIAAGPDGNVWFTEPYSARIGRMTLAGDVTEFATNTVSASIAAGPDGNVWFAQEGAVCRILAR